MSKNKPFISILTDYGFKVVFADESNTLFLRRSIQALIEDQRIIERVTFIRNEKVALTEEGRISIFDLLCEDEHGRVFLVEMQLARHKNFMQRLKFYAFHELNTQVKKGKEESFENLKPIYCIAFVAKKIFPQSNQYYHFGRLKNQVGEELDNTLTFIIVELSKFDKELPAIESNLEKLIYTMNYLDHRDPEKRPDFISEEWLRQAADRLDESKMSPRERQLHEMNILRIRSELEIQREKIKQAVQETTERVERETAERVERETTERVEREKTKQIASDLKDSGMAIAEIARITGLSVEDVNNL